MQLLEIPDQQAGEFTDLMSKIESDERLHRLIYPFKLALCGLFIARKAGHPIVLFNVLIRLNLVDFFNRKEILEFSGDYIYMKNKFQLVEPNRDFYVDYLLGLAKVEDTQKRNNLRERTNYYSHNFPSNADLSDLNIDKDIEGVIFDFFRAQADIHMDTSGELFDTLLPQFIDESLRESESEENSSEISKSNDENEESFATTIEDSDNHLKELLIKYGFFDMYTMARRNTLKGM
jgi:hypothetical protein